ncbi:hypothetical protein C8R43DRAFT_961563 [Mycena crocata]|nr:hypothetical protein C8R43DRAFT_961563 [Mycena crocata]
MSDLPTYGGCVPGSSGAYLLADADKGCVLPGFTTTVSSVLSAAIELLAEFNLRFTEVRLMQRATGTIIAGSAVTSLLPVQNDIDFFARITCGLKIIRFLQMNNYSVDSTHYSYHNHVNVNIVECSSYYPFNTVVKFHSNPVFVGWTDKVIWFGYASMSAAGVAITSSSLTAFHGDLGHFQRIWYVLKKYMRCGFMYYLEEYPEPHVCGRDFNCPATQHISNDAGCTTVDIPMWEFSGPPSDPLFTWHLGPRCQSKDGTAGCNLLPFKMFKNGNGWSLNLGGTGWRPRSFSTPQAVSTWLRRMRNLLSLEDAPRTLVDVV